jgi:hypothetical protein
MYDVKRGSFFDTHFVDNTQHVAAVRKAYGLGASIGFVVGALAGLSVMLFV